MRDRIIGSNEHSEAPLSLAWLRTSMVYLEGGGRRVLTDPWFSGSMRGLPVFRKAAWPIERVPVPDLVLLSHLHADHYRRQDLKQLCGAHTHIIAPPGSEHILRGLPGRLQTPEPGRTVEVAGIPVTTLRARHTGPPPDEHVYFFRLAGHNIFFGGDTAFFEPPLGAIPPEGTDLAMLPVGGSRILGRRTVMNAADAARFAGLIRARSVLPIHPGGEWMPVPPLSLHPGRREHLPRHLPPDVRTWLPALGERIEISC